ncbi:unnamed protein product [Thlaspi arvense]|uniref:Uncharacterized protein n=1 Tax=Thlaspi arvense TaxID=13288 RepID=A0AAU9RLV7_THLAR|nr:unnamed protein product [Thlaspi arvense]
MARSSADDQDLKRACEAAIEGSKEKIEMSMRVAKSHGIWGKSAKLGSKHMAKPRILAITSTPFLFLLRFYYPKLPISRRILYLSNANPCICAIPCINRS